jgi:hypothetical protein
MLILSVNVREEVYSFTPNDGTEEIHILSGKLREWLHANAKHKLIDLHFPTDETEEQLIERHGLEQPRMDSMTIFEANEPVIVGIHPSGTHILIDGAHRRWFWWKQGINTIRGWAVPMTVWETFTFNPKDMPEMLHHRDGSLLPQRRKG